MTHCSFQQLQIETPRGIVDRFVEPNSRAVGHVCNPPDVLYSSSVFMVMTVREDYSLTKNHSASGTTYNAVACVALTFEEVEGLQ